MRSVCFALFLALLGGCATSGTYVGSDHRDQPTPPLPTGEITHEVFLTGNTADAESDAVLQALRAEMERAGELGTLVFLGDQVPNGIPDSASAARAEAETRMDALVNAARGLEGRIVVVPGDRDWARGEDGLKAQEDYLEDALDADVLTPGDQSGGPREIELADGLRLLVVDTGWWLQDPEDRPEGEAEDQDIRSPADVASVLEAIIADRDDDRLVAVGHHPLRSNGPRAGARTLGQTVSGLGLTALVAQTFGRNRQDLASSKYRDLRASLDHLFAEHNRLVYAAGHERNLAAFTVQRSPITQQTYLSSGTGGGAADPAARGGGADFQSSQPGYQRLVYFDDGRLWMETVEVGPEGQAEVVFRAELAGVNRERVDPELPDEVLASQLPDDLGEIIETSAEADFARPFNNDAFTRAIFGVGYRDTWKTRIEIPVLDIGAVDGGLVPVKQGGGLQTTSLRLQGENHQYNIRLLEKGGLASVPVPLREGAVGDVVLGLRSAQTPFGILVADPLERAAGIITSGAQIVYVPDDPRLGRYREIFAGRVGLFQIRADDDMSDVPGFEGITEVVSAQKVREEMAEDQDHRIDQRTYLRARLFDVLIGDWDRHSDQWRWAAFEPFELDPSLTGDEATRGKVYQPIPRDRDFAFYGFGGLVGEIVRLADKRLRNFNDSFGSLTGATANGFPQDRRFLNQMTEADYVAAAEDLQTRLTDDVIDEAVRQLPPAAYALRGEQWTSDLKSRRGLLVDVARGIYRLQADVVDVIGSDERELFEVVHRGDETEVAVFSYKKRQRGAELYRRVFPKGDTDEIRLYGFSGRDRFEISGEGGVFVRVIGGGGEDELVATATGAKTKAYDAIDGMEADEAQGVALLFSDNAEVNRYDPHAYVPKDHSWVPSVGYTATDGAILGVGSTWSLPGFRLRPYGAQHTVYANVATATGGLAGGYTGRMREAVGELDLDVDALASTPRYVRNFYGIGNASPEISGENARVDIARAQADVLFGGQAGQGVRFTLGPTVRYADARLDTAQTRLPAFERLPERELRPQAHAGVLARLSVSTTDAVLNPRQGLQLDVHGAIRLGVTEDTEDYRSLGGSATAYIPLSFAPQVTLALRAGADHRSGDYPFYDAAVLGGSDALRGFRRERFAGRTAAYGNAEVRTKLFNLATYVVPFEVGALAFADAGRVWSDEMFGFCPIFPPCVPGFDPDGDQGLHLGYGGGLWIGALDQFLLNITVAQSDEGTQFGLGLGFQY
ncbi:MAG: metallophosphoesterase [Rubricoccaceae bacterium]